MKIAKIALATACMFGSIAAASAQGGGGGGGGGAGGGGGNSPAATSGQGASSSPGAANPGATMNDPKSKDGSGSASAMKQETMPKDHMKNRPQPNRWSFVRTPQRPMAAGREIPLAHSR
ncbi:hypothetical protein [Bradyrhizobium brasilense]|nr:hypothetical protein [Bradyrhizobium brasilense]